MSNAAKFVWTVKGMVAKHLPLFLYAAQNINTQKGLTGDVNVLTAPSFTVLIRLETGGALGYSFCLLNKHFEF